MIAPTRSERLPLLRRALMLQCFTLAWMLIEAAVAIGSGIAARSATLIAFGADSIIELISALVVLCRLIIELDRGQDFPEAVEARTRKIAGSLLLLLAAYVLINAGWNLWHRTGAEFSLPGLLLAVVAVPAMYALSRTKMRLAELLGSNALRADAVEAIACGYLSLVVVVALIAQVLLHAWWIDAAASLAILYILIKEGREVRFPVGAIMNSVCLNGFRGRLPFRPFAREAAVFCGVLRPRVLCPWLLRRLVPSSSSRKPRSVDCRRRSGRMKYHPPG